jgi:hypothetical protein
MSLGPESGSHSPESIQQVVRFHYRAAELVVPPPSLLDRFFKIILPTRKQLLAIIRKYVNQTGQRGALLFKLISDQLRVPHSRQPIWRQVWC